MLETRTLSLPTLDKEVSLSSTMMGSEKQNSATQIYQSSHPDLRQLPRMSVDKF